MLPPTSVGADMRLKSFTLFAALLCGAATGVSAQGTGGVPANIPPESFTGRQYVDNKGCVFVRAGFDGAVTWVPRVNRQRQQICGQTPTFGGTTAAAAPAPAPAPAPAATAPVVITNTAPVEPAAPQRTRVALPAATEQTGTLRPATDTGVTIARQPTQTTVVRPRPTAQPQPVQVKRAPASKPVTAPPPRLVRKVPAQPAPAPASKPLKVVPDAAAASGCGATAVSRQYMGRNGAAVRCGPQKTPHVTVIRRGEAPGPGKNVYYNKKAWEDQSSLSLPGNTRIVPRHVYEAQDPAKPVVPAGYRPAWQDDRLNPYRAWQTVDGYRATQTVWTNTVPRSLAATARRHTIKQPVIAYRATGAAPKAQAGRTLRVTTISAKNRPAATDAQYVEIGVFTTDAKADSAVARLAAAGLPVKLGKYRKGGQLMTRVLTGPYASPADLSAALTRVRLAGYANAYLR